MTDRSAAQAHLASIPLVQFDELSPRPPRVLIDDCYAKVDGSLGRNELRWVLQLAKQQKPKAVLEIGTYFGSTTYNLAVNLPNAVIHTVDLPPNFWGGNDPHVPPKDDLHLIQGRRLGEAFRGQPEAARIVQHLGDTARYDFSAIHEPLGMFFIDGSHNYQYARNDSLVCLSLASGPALVLWHDCDAAHPGVADWLGEMVAAGIPVRRLANSTLAFLQCDPQAASIQQFLIAHLRR